MTAEIGTHKVPLQRNKFNRMKKFFLLAALTLFTTGAWAQVSTNDTRSADQLGWKLAVHSYTFQKFSIFDAIDMTAALGVKYMSISGGVILEGSNRLTTVNLTDAQRAAIDKKLRADGFGNFVNIGVVQLPADEAKSRQVFEFAKKWGINVLVAEPGPDALDTVEKLCEEYHIKVAIHDHPKPSHYWNPDTVLAAIQGRPMIGACADVGHWIRSGLDPLECIKKLDGHIICLHFKDLNEMGPKAHDVPWGTGVGKTRQIMEELKRQHFQGAFCVEYEYHWDNSSPEIAQCVKFFNQTCDELVAADAK
jgi:sugar phosphate isomerase/epimerase